MLELMFSGYEKIFINGNFYDVEEDKVVTPLVIISIYNYFLG